MAPFAIVKHLDVVEQIGPGFVPGSIPNAIDALAFEQAEEALDDGIVVTVPRTAHAALNAMFGEFVPEAVAGILAAPVGVMDERALGFAPGFTLASVPRQRL